MNDPYPDPATLNPVPAYKDRSIGLKIFGILTLLMGGLCALFVVTIPMAAHAARNPNSHLVPALIVYAFLAVALTWLGVGSFMLRRWARTLILAFSWSWLVVGIFTTAFMAWLLPKMMPAVMAQSAAAGAPGQPKLPPGTLDSATSFIIIGTIIFMACIMVLLPIVWIAFYSGRNVRATCQARDPVQRWTDACPLPVLIAVVWAAYSAVTMLFFPFMMGHVALPFFGIILSGLPAILLSLVYAAVAACIAWLFYRLSPGGWWFALLTWLLLMASSFITFSRVDLLELYRKMGYTQADLDAMKNLGALAMVQRPWVMLTCSLPFIIYLVWIKRYFRPANQAANLQQA